MTIQNILRTGLVGLCLAIPMGCGQNVNIQRMGNFRVEAETQKSYLEGKVLSSEYTQTCHGNCNMLSFMINNNGDNTLCFRRGTNLSISEDIRYNLASTVIKSAIENKSDVKVYGKITPEYFEINTIEVNGFKITINNN
jgi:hypothetical protein